MTKQSKGVVQSEAKDHVLKITIHNPAKKNAFDPDMMLQLSNALTELHNNPDFVGWCHHQPRAITSRQVWTCPSFLALARIQHQSLKQISTPLAWVIPATSRSSLPFKGICFTIGIEMALAGDIIVAADNTRFCQMEAKRGIAPLGGAHFRYIERAGWGNGMYHLLLCDEFDAAEAYRVGLVQEVVPAGTQVVRAMELANIIKKNAPLGIQATKIAGRKYIEAGEASAVAAIANIREQVMETEDAKVGPHRSWSVVLLYLREDRVCLGSNIVSAYKQTNWGLCCFVPIDFLF